MKESAPPKKNPNRSTARRSNPSLIEFPGVNRSTLPEWRKELGERVREAQEKRAQKALAEAGEIEPLFSELEPKPTPMLELLPQTEVAPMNPIVVAALRRIERAHSQPGSNAVTATALAYEEHPTVNLDPIPTHDAIDEPVIKPERVHNLAVVPALEVSSPAREVTEPEVRRNERPKPRRVIGEQDDPALNYLDSISTTVRVDRRGYDSAPLFRRMFSALVDLLVVGLISSPLLALTGLTKVAWQNPRVIGFAAGSFLVIGFLYLTISVAFTGRTLGMKLFALRVVDARTGLIPTGSQSAGRSVVYLLTLAAAGVALMYMFISREKHTVHDRFTRTSVIRA
ncbi:MAG TPA: RDD family protein [Pyrinomonadaceae bacterium]|jgi:uncharacterized RDD family membrane protein YckC|nr:RDD family protein [Pyrinomonadaceae bacterium]